MPNFHSFVEPVVIYYDYEPDYGVNAVSQAFDCEMIFFKNWSDFNAFLISEYDCFQLIELNEEVRLRLLSEGFFNEL